MAAWALPLRPQTAEYQLRVSESLGSTTMARLRRRTARWLSPSCTRDKPEEAVRVSGFGIQFKGLIGAIACFGEIAGVRRDTRVDVLPVDLALGGEQEDVFADETFADFKILERTGERVFGVVENFMFGHQVVTVCLDVGKWPFLHLLVLCGR